MTRVQLTTTCGAYLLTSLWTTTWPVPVCRYCRAAATSLATCSRLQHQECNVLTVSMATGLPGSGEIVTVLQVAIERASWEERVEEAEVRTVITVPQDPEQVGVAQPAKGRVGGGCSEGVV